MKLSITLVFALLFLGSCSTSKKTNLIATTVATGNVSRPTIAIDSTTGTIYVTWIGKKGTVSNVYFSRLKPGNAKFSNPVRLNRIRGNAKANVQAPPQVVVSPSGFIYVAWMNRRHQYPISNIYVARSEDSGKTFSPAITVDNPPFPDGQIFHNIAVGPKGIVYVSWLDYRNSNLLKLSNSHSMNNMDMKGSSVQIRVARSTNHAKSFEPSIVIAKHTCECCRTAITVGNDGRVYVAWRQIFGDNIRDIAVAQSSDYGKDLSSVIRVHKDGWQINACPHDGPSIVTNSQGDVFVIWYTGAKGKAGVYLAKAEEPDLNFGKPTLLTRSEGTAQVEADVSGNGNFWFAWENSEKVAIEIGNYIDGKLDKSFATINNGSLPSIAVTNEKVAVTYLDGDSVKVWMHRLKSF